MITLHSIPNETISHIDFENPVWRGIAKFISYYTYTYKVKVTLNSNGEIIESYHYTAPNSEVFSNINVSNQIWSSWDENYPNISLDNFDTSYIIEEYIT